MSKRTIALPHPEYDIDVLKRLIAEAEAPPPPTFQVGQWVKHKDATNWPAEKVIAIAPDDRFTLKLSPACYGDPKFYRLATPEEIAAATRIQPKFGLLLKSKVGCCAVYLVCFGGKGYSFLRIDCAGCTPKTADEMGSLSTEDYDILPRYTIEGAEP